MGLFNIFKSKRENKANIDKKITTTAKNDIKLVGHDKIKRILSILPNDETGYFEKYYSIDISTGALCITDHSFAGGYGGGYYDFVDELERYDIPYDELTAYCETTSPLLQNVFKGIQRNNFSEYLEKFNSLPKSNRFLPVALELLNRRDFIIEKTIQTHNDFCIHLCRRNDAYILVLECLTYKANVTQWYMLLKEVDIENENSEALIAYTDNIITNLQVLETNLSQTTCCYLPLLLIAAQAAIKG